MLKGKKRKINYEEKYDPNNPNLRIVFDYIYNHEIKTYGIRSNMVAVSGEYLGIYVSKYIPSVIGNIGKAIVMELSLSRLRRLRKQLVKFKTKHVKKIKIIHGDITSYVNHPLVRKFMTTPARFLDLGLGNGINNLTAIARLMLHQQQRVFKYKKKKVIILDTARRRVSDINCIGHLNSFLEPINQKIIKVNGKGLNDLEHVLALGIPFNKALPSKKQPMKHSVILKGDNRRQASLTLYTYMNGSGMLTAVLKYL